MAYALTDVANREIGSGPGSSVQHYFEYPKYIETGPYRHCRLNGDRRRQIRGRNGVDGTRARQDRRRGQRGTADVPPPNITAQVRALPRTPKGGAL